MTRRFTFSLLWVFLAISSHARAQNFALNLTGTNYVTGNVSEPVLPANGDFTVEFWTYVPSLVVDGKSHIFLYEGTAGLSFYMGYDATGSIILGDGWTDPTGTTTVSTGIAMPTGRWTHMALTFSLTGGASFYLDGIHRLDNINYFYIDDGTPFDIGMMPNPSNGVPQGFMTAWVDNIRVWSGVRSAQQIKTSMFGGAITASDPTLLAWYKMDDGTTATSLTNSSEVLPVVGNNIPLVGGASWVSSPIQTGNNALTFDGADDQVIIPAASQYDLTTGTVEFWVNPASLSSSFSTVLGNRGPGGVRYSFHVSSTQVGFDNGSGIVPLTLSLGQQVQPGVWTHLAFVEDGSQIAVYVNGVAAGTIMASFGTANGQPLTIGNVNTPTPSSGEVIFAGGIDEVRIWSSQQSPTAIAANEGSTLTGTESGLVGQFTFDQGVAGADNTGLTTAFDNTANNNHGQLTNFSLLASSPASDFNVHTLTPVTLPLTLTLFTATKEDNEALLNWETAQEENTSTFVIERSTDGKTFTSIGTVAAAGNSVTPRDYSFTDLAPEIKNDYYRLRQTDLDGKYTYSPVRLLYFTSAGSLIWYSTGPESVEVYLKQGSNEKYSLSDIAGHSLRVGQLVNGKTSISGFPAGMYIVKIMTATGQSQDVKVILP